MKRKTSNGVAAATVQPAGAGSSGGFLISLYYDSGISIDPDTGSISAAASSDVWFDDSCDDGEYYCYLESDVSISSVESSSEDEYCEDCAEVDSGVQVYGQVTSFNTVYPESGYHYGYGEEDFDDCDDCDVVGKLPVLTKAASHARALTHVHSAGEGGDCEDDGEDDGYCWEYINANSSASESTPAEPDISLSSLNTSSPTDVEIQYTDSGAALYYSEFQLGDPGSITYANYNGNPIDYYFDLANIVLAYDGSDGGDFTLYITGYLYGLSDKGQSCPSSISRLDPQNSAGYLLNTGGSEIAPEVISFGRQVAIEGYAFSFCENHASNPTTNLVFTSALDYEPTQAVTYSIGILDEDVVFYNDTTHALTEQPPGIAPDYPVYEYTGFNGTGWIWVPPGSTQKVCNTGMTLVDSGTTVWVGSLGCLSVTT
ncbi:MAG: hypothetical protein JO340_02145 [Acidobacteriaceae bacterium]|nr:hypothetical protein [Acidobacteriaceae bacterium]